jgi:hypothetical protein
VLARSILVGVYGNSLEAGLGQALLEEEGIAAEIENLTSQSWLAGDVPLTGFRLFVAREDAERALAVLARPPLRALTQADEAGPEASLAPGAAESLAPAAEDDDEQAFDNREAHGPMAALALGTLLSLQGPLTTLAAGWWTLALLGSAAGRRLSGRMRFLLRAGVILFGAGVVGGNVALRGDLLDGSSGWVRARWGVDAAVALIVARGYLIARRRWPAR